MHKKIIIAVAALVLVPLLGFLSLPLLIDKTAIKKEIVGAFNTLTGLTLEIQGDAEVHAFPLPHVVIDSLYVRNAPGAASSFLLSVKWLDVRPSFASLFSHQLVIDSLAVSGVDVELENLKNNQMNWRDSALRPSAGATATPSMGAVFSASSIAISDAVVRYTDTPAGTVSEYKNAGMVINNGAAGYRSSFRANFRYGDYPFTVDGHVDDALRAVSSGTTPASINIISGATKLSYTGEIGWKDNNMVVKGNVAAETNDVVPWVSLALGNTSKAAVAGTPYGLLPLQAKSDVVMENGRIALPNVALGGAVIKGNVQASLTLPYTLDVKAAIDSFDLEALSASNLWNLNAESGNTKEVDSTNSLIPLPSRSLFNSLVVTADIRVADMLYNHQHIRDTHLGFDMSGGEMTIPQASASLPGDSRLLFAGIGKKGYEGFTLEGEIDANGSNFAEMISIIKPKGCAIPAEDFKRFLLKTNAVISGKEARFSETAVRIENIGIVGGIIATFDTRPGIQAALRITGVNLDHFITLWGLEAWRTSFLSSTQGDAKSDSFLSQWLKRLDYNLQLNISLEQYVLNNIPRDKTDFKLEATQGKIELNGIKTSYNGSVLSGKAAIDVTQPLPHVDLDMTADTMDAAVFLSPDGKTPKSAPQKATGELWSHNAFDLHWLELLSATYHLKCEHFKDGIFQGDSLDLKGSVDNNTLTIDTLTMFTLGGAIAAKATVKAGTNPTLNLVANVRELDTERLSLVLPLLWGMTGKYNMNLALATSGIDMYSWVSNLQGTVGMSGRDVVVHGFNMPGIIQAVAYVRTVADILDVVKRAFPGGDTLFSGIEGEWILANGVLKASNVKLTSAEANGSLIGDINLVNWTLQSTITFMLSSLDATHPPSISIGFTGNLDAPEKTLDTHSLEQYVTNKTSEKMLNEYGQ